mmetsp:Transcript_6095/g.12612  ORF Transcript_6095/g.12612 Transcript_6095/m.12612 type:complete len:168 (+) Transcript_6095:1939-2442(+)
MQRTPTNSIIPDRIQSKRLGARAAVTTAPTPPQTTVSNAALNPNLHSSETNLRPAPTAVLHPSFLLFLALAIEVILLVARFTAIMRNALDLVLKEITSTAIASSMVTPTNTLMAMTLRVLINSLIKETSVIQATMETSILATLQPETSTLMSRMRGSSVVQTPETQT